MSKKALICAAKFYDLEIGQFEIAPIMQPRSFGSGPADRRVSSRTSAASRAMSAAFARRRIALAPGLKYMERC